MALDGAESHFEVREAEKTAEIEQAWQAEIDSGEPSIAAVNNMLDTYVFVFGEEATLANGTKREIGWIAVLPDKLQGKLDMEDYEGTDYARKIEFVDSRLAALGVSKRDAYAVPSNHFIREELDGKFYENLDNAGGIVYAFAFANIEEARKAAENVFGTEVIQLNHVRFGGSMPKEVDDDRFVEGPFPNLTEGFTVVTWCPERPQGIC
jgi:hypothetical protein